MKLSTAFACIVSTTSLQSGFAKNPGSLRGYDQGQSQSSSLDVTGPWDTLKCTVAGKNDGATCATALTTDGDACSYCTMDKYGPDVGICIDPEVAVQIHEANLNVTCTNTDTIALDSTSANIITTTGFDKEEFKCEIEASNDADKCATTMTVGEESCQFCTLEGPFGSLGFCFSPDHADKLKGAVGDQISCDSSLTKIASSEDVEGPFDVLKCTFEAKNDEATCATSLTVDGDACSFCTLSSNGQEASICVDPEIAAKMKQQNPDVTCTNTGLTNPVIDCDIDGIDHDTCLDPSKVKGSKCIWCDADIGGFCFPQEWKTTASKVLKCEDPNAIDEVEMEPKDEQLSTSIDPSFLKSNCFKTGLTGASPDDCRAAVDDKTEEHCIFCNAPNFGGIGLCMTPEFKGNEGRFYVCDDNAILSIE